MRRSRFHLSAMWQLAAIAILVVIDLESAYAWPPKCGKRCKRNQNGVLVCRIPGTWTVARCPTGEGSEGGPSAAPSPYDDVYIPALNPDENFHDIASLYELTGYVYDVEDQRYEYEDGTVVPGFEAPTPDPVDSFPPRRKRCKRRDKSCKTGCRKGRCCLDGRLISCRRYAFRNLDDADPPDSYMYG
jgi:hypothetical protein